jgi:hypothetical protein
MSAGYLTKALIIDTEPYSNDPVPMMAASEKSLQLYTSFGVGRSSTARKPPILSLQVSVIDAEIAELEW